MDAEMLKKVREYLSESEILAQLAEEAAELSQAALKLRRAIDGRNPTPRSIEECEHNLLEELADVKVAFEVYCSFSKPFIVGMVANEIDKTADMKTDRWLKRLEQLIPKGGDSNEQ